MAAPVRSRLPRREAIWKVNDDPRKLDSFYVQFLGPGGDSILTDETKWLAVTHKSFDHGRRGFNDRLSYLGKRIVELQMSLALLGSSTRDVFKVAKDPHGRTPFQHPATEGIEVLNGGARAHLLHHSRISEMSQRYGLQHVVRWNPRKPESLHASGFEMVLTQAVFAIAGAVALERGGGEANRIVRERIIVPLGVRSQILEHSKEELVE
ncbi:hypothetical protein EPUS_07141 [Endocarpon pusillum Z07020]|uniref:RNase III domain-containing protein n=1 Tax=Endocarpon pusillum (strain Z07020 / HMAS-L-300199) TaxID=1263415 RepID=U1G9P9_ENDPU|nr:uncharacterized protein EPUS_07141 [Endocarpon pusillum Z07020]ERF68723.1 hypothetical protein EPUS_07141 [Endocarpon pusillum Z07020]